MTNHRQNHPSRHAKYGLKHGKIAVFSLENDKRHTSAVRSNTFLSPGIARKWREIHASRPKMEGNVQHEGQSGGRLAAQERANCQDYWRSHLPRLPTARGGGAHEGGRTHPVPQHAQGGEDRPHVQRLPKAHQAAHLTRGKAHRESPE